MSRRNVVRSLVAAATLASGLLAVSPAHAAEENIPDGTQFYVPKRGQEAQRQIASLRKSGDKAGAALIKEMTETPSAVWFTKGTPAEVQKAVRKTVARAEEQGTVPVLVAYNLPFRDCAQYSAGGATTVEEYKEWIDAFAAGIGDAEVVVIVEPDGLGIIPWYTTFEGTQEWCQPAEADAATAAAERFEMLNYAVDVLQAQPNASVYLDGTHSAWLNVGDITDRLIKAGVEDADGFYLNASNYQYTANLVEYGTWISSCIEYVTEVNPGDMGSCGNQYWSGGPANNWTGVTLSNYGEWSDTATDPTLNTAGINSRYDLILGGVEPTTHFVIDTSRNGQGPWEAPAGVYPDAQDWCNPPDRGLGIRPTTDTGNELVDAYLWIKIPGESDGQCDRGTGTGLDPARGNIADPAAGVWFPEQAYELATLAVPALTP